MFQASRLAFVCLCCTFQLINKQNKSHLLGAIAQLLFVSGLLVPILSLHFWQRKASGVRQ